MFDFRVPPNLRHFLLSLFQCFKIFFVLFNRLTTLFVLLWTIDCNKKNVDCVQLCVDFGLDLNLILI